MANESLTLPEQDEDTSTHIKRQPPYVVLIHNDDFNGMDFVVRVLQQVLKYPIERCVHLTLEAHQKGLAAVWQGAMEVAELKADLIVGFGPDPQSKSKEPIRVTIEPVA